MAGFGSLASAGYEASLKAAEQAADSPAPYQPYDQEASDYFDMLRKDEAKKAAAERTWGDTFGGIAGFPRRMFGALAQPPVWVTNTPQDPAGGRIEQARRLLSQPSAANVVPNLAAGLVEAVKSGVTLPGDVMSGDVPFYDRDGNINPQVINRSFDLASIAGGGSLVRNATRGAPTLGRDVRVLGRKVGSGEPFQHQLIDQPPVVTEPYIPLGPADAMQRPIEARIDAGLGRAANDRGLTSVPRTGSLLEDSAAAGAPIAALETTQRRPVAGFGQLAQPINPLDNAAQLAELANQRRAKGWNTGKSAPGHDFKRPDPEAGSFDRAHATASAYYDAQKPSPASPLMSADDHAFIASGKFLSDSAAPGAPIAALEHAGVPRVDWSTIGAAERSLSPATARALDSWVGGTVDTMAAMEKGQHPGFGIFDRNALQKNPAALDELSARFQPMRDELKATHGDTVTLYRYPGDIPEGATPHDLLSFTSEPKVAESLTGAARKDRPIIPESEIAAKEAELEKTGRTQIDKGTWLEKKRDMVWNGKEDVPVDYIAIMRHDGMVTDTDGVRAYIGEENAWNAEQNAKRAAARSKVKTYQIPVDDIMAATDRFGQKEFIVRNSTGLFEDSATAGAPIAALERAKQQGFNIDAFHGTSAPPFEAFKRKQNDIGIHFGTADQANDRLSYMGDRRTGDQHVYPVKLKIKNPLRLDDLGGWGSDNLDYGLRNARKADGTPLFDPEEIRSAIYGTKYQRGPGNESGKIAALRDLIERKGYDGVVYKNTGETGGSEPYRAAVAEAREKMDAAFGGKPKYIFSREQQQHPAYQEWRKADDSYDRHRKENAQDSYIAFHPHQVRSQFAEFNQRDAKKGGLLLEDAAATGAPLAAAEHAARAKSPASAYHALLDQPAASPPASAYHAQLDQPAGGAYIAPHGTETAPAAREAAPAARGDVTGGAGGGDRGLSEAAAAAARRAGARQPLEGLPTAAMKIGDEHFVPGPIDQVHKVAEQYLAGRETPSYHKPPTKYHPLDEEHSRSIARAFEEMKHEPDNPAVKHSYDALINETAAQYQAIKKSGLKIEAIPPDMPDPYAANPRLAAKDVADNNHLWYFPTDAGFGSNPGAGIDMATHPMMRKTGEQLGGREMLANDMFRIVHDYFGHLKEGYGFRAGGEDNAWRSHASMYSDLARPAMTTERRGQNSWVNYGPHGERNRTASAADTVYADQKVGLMPEWTMRDRRSAEPIIAYHGSPYSFDKFDISKIGAGEGNQSYGHGLYFAGHSPVSEWYRHQLAARRDPLLQKYGLDSEDGANLGMRMAAKGGDPTPEIAGLQQEIMNLKSQGESKAVKNMIARREGMINYLKDPERSKGQMYEVAIDHPIHKFLDWDTPLNKHHPDVQDAVKRAMSTDYHGNSDPAKAERMWKEFGGADAGDAVRRGFIASDDKLVADRLKAGGVPGIRYLDEGSRLTGLASDMVKKYGSREKALEVAQQRLTEAEGTFGSMASRDRTSWAKTVKELQKPQTHNYVTFDAPRLLKKYALPGAVGFGAMAMPRDEQ